MTMWAHLDKIAVVTVALAAAGVLFAVLGLAAAVRKRLAGFALGLLATLVCVALAGVLTAVALGMQGYRALTREEVVAVVETESTGPHTFQARFFFPDGGERSFALAGDEFYVDARILKWKSIANVLGLHTAYELDRVAGRYVELGAELKGPRTVYSLAGNRYVDLFALRRTHALLAPVVDAEYGSATYAPAANGARFEVRISPTGLMVRPATIGVRRVPPHGDHVR
jgi:hypothetical protein